jgi:hypothetical protein
MINYTLERQVKSGTEKNLMLLMLIILLLLMLLVLLKPIHTQVVHLREAHQCQTPLPADEPLSQPNHHRVFNSYF